MTPIDLAHTGRLENAPRATVFVDIADYLAAAKSTMDQARRSIHLLNWAFEPDTRFDPTSDTAEGEIGEYLKARAAAGLDVRLLCWKAPLMVAAGQHFFTWRDRHVFRGSAVKLLLDNGHPFGACHHQKMIVVDDAVAFCGGADMGPDRWDTQAHLDDDPRRKHGRKTYDSRHEVMAVVDGPAASALGDIFRERWRRACGEILPRPGPIAPEAWPERVGADLTDVGARISRTVGAWRGHPEVREAFALTLASFAAAQRTIYLENQYFTSPVAAEALAARLQEPDGPEVIMVAPQHSPSWFDRMTMDRTRVEFIKRLMTADRFGRFHSYSPVTTLGRIIIVHAKLAIVDDDFLRIGSANLNNRSTGFDTECDLTFHARTESNRGFIGVLRNRLVAHWLGCDSSELGAALRAQGRLGAAIETLRAAGRNRLRSLGPRRLSPVARFVAAFHLGDPVGPDDSFHLVRRQRRLAADARAVARALNSR
ncbi:MAG TPA: phospholipase D-like domain-containing protein [Caulobacteraceae bacterium]|nr:phospholipase D-like domain-containing protein [Caulobacteraceae bacterium]